MSKEIVEILTENEQALEECVRIYLLLYLKRCMEDNLKNCH